MSNLDPDQLIEKYIQSVSTKEDHLLASINRYTHLHTVHPRMLSGQVQGKVLELISRMICPQYILETGTFTGYSAICLARGLKPGGKLVTIEMDEEMTEISTSFFSKSGLDHLIELIHGDALQVIPGLNQVFDLVFMDLEKEDYIRCYELIITKVRPGGFILADNTLWDGKVLDDPGTWDATTAAVHAFNLHVQHDPRVENVILPVRDGLSLIRKVE